MFFPVDSLRRGGRFYLCWIADSWPLRFANLPQNQLWSHDIRRICDDLLEVVNTESGRPNNRFSLRLTSQLLRGLVRVYQRKTNLLMGNICMINAKVTKHINKKYTFEEIDEKRVRRAVVTLKAPLELFLPHEELHENEQRVETMIENNTNVVSNIQEITLRENEIPAFQPPTDGFGEENAEQAIQMLTDRTMEMILQQTDASTTHSGLDLPMETTDKSQDRSRFVAPDARMERISEQDITVFGRLPPAVHPSSPVPFVLIPYNKEMEVDPNVPQVPAREEPQIPEEMELEELDNLQHTRRRRARKFIIDKRTKISSTFFRSRLDNDAVELRCETPYDDTIEIRLPWEEYVRRPAHCGRHVYSLLAFGLTQLYQRSLNINLDRIPLATRELQEAMTYRRPIREPLETVVEEVELVVQERPQPRMQELLEAKISKENTLNITEPRVSVPPMEVDISDLPTQILPQESVQPGKRKSQEVLSSPKRQAVGVAYIRRGMDIRDIEADKENIPENIDENRRLSQSNLDPQLRIVAQVLRETGLNDESERVLRGSNGRKLSSRGSSETPLGSLDRTKVSLGDSEPPTESMRLIREEWGILGTIEKILLFYHHDRYPTTVRTLIAAGPLVPGKESIIAARCFVSILCLKQRGIIRIHKDPKTLEIRHIEVGERIKNGR
ncbi:hypothetical protein K1T71_008929 [Dendrolimus kikuchii]|uniref:Uncharacterized protein n=1 Tax=Dendrolimus kikuchii TaxID=765133 RepID=A0ACC1CVT9_9NEOP|nr:hypothetical protein K1T71_008929 [Dendrolimus kikuchii]